MKTFATWMTFLGFFWVGFWLSIVDKEMTNQLQRALNDGFSKYTK
jgi:hypothetical protein